MTRSTTTPPRWDANPSQDIQHKVTTGALLLSPEWDAALHGKVYYPPPQRLVGFPTVILVTKD